MHGFFNGSSVGFRRNGAVKVPSDTERELGGRNNAGVTFFYGFLEVLFSEVSSEICNGEIALVVS